MKMTDRTPLFFSCRLAHDNERGLMSSQALIPNTEAAILARVIECDAMPITVDVARYLLSLQLPRIDEDRVNELSGKARAGSLSQVETQELESYLHIGRLLAIMQSRARRLLNHPDNACQ
jgi:hypothetical protein